MFGIKSKLKPRIKPVISGNKASKSEETKNEFERTTSDGSSYPPSSTSPSEEPSPPRASQEEATTTSYKQIEPEQCSTARTIPESSPVTLQKVQLDPVPPQPAPTKSPTDSMLPLSTEPSGDDSAPQKSLASSKPHQDPSSLEPESTPISATVPDSPPLKSNELMAPPESPAPKSRFTRKPPPLLRIIRKPAASSSVDKTTKDRTEPPPSKHVEATSEDSEDRRASIQKQVEARPPSPLETSATGPIQPMNSVDENICDKNSESSKPIAPALADQEVKNKIGRSHMFKPTLDRQRTPKFTTSTYGKMSSEAKAQMLKKFGTTTPDLSKLTMLDLIFYNPKINGMQKMPVKAQTEKPKKTEPTPAENNDAPEDENSNISNKPDTAPTPKIKLDGSGKAVVDTESVIIRNKAPDEVDSEVISEEAIKSKKPTKRKRENNFWNYEDTIKFYKGLLKYGSDFTMMLSEFPERDRRSLKSKFKREEKVNGKLIDKVIGTGFQLFDADSLETELSTTLCPPAPSKPSKKRHAEEKKTEKVVERSKRRVREMVRSGLKWAPKCKKARRKSTDSEDGDSVAADSPPHSSSAGTATLDNSDDERASVVSDVAREDFIKEFLQNGQVAINTSIVSNSLTCSQSIRLDSHGDKPLDVNLTVSHSVETAIGGET